MAVPPEFSETEHLQNLIRRYINKAVREDFRDLGGDDWDPDLTTTRGSMRYGLTHQDNDSMQVTLARMFLYYFTFGKARQLQPTIIGLEKQEWDEKVSVAYRPKVILYFRQDLDAVPSSQYPIKARISFRLMNETTETFTKANLESLALKIKNEMALSQGYTFDKGKYLCKYFDPENGYDFQIYALSDAEGEQVARKIVSIQNHSFVEDKFTLGTPRRNTLNTPGNIQILGKSYKKSRWRPTGKVRFMYADLILHNLPDAKTLVDRSGLRPNPIEFVS